MAGEIGSRPKVIFDSLEMGMSAFSLYGRYLSWAENGTEAGPELQLEFANRTFRSPSDEYFQ